MANLILKIGALDLSQYVRVNPGEGLNPGAGDMLDPAFSDSPLFEGQTLTSLHAKNKEMIFPLYVHPSQAPYSNSDLNSLVQQINQALRPVIDLGQTVYCQYQNAQANFPTFFTIQFARFEPDFNFRVSEKGWLAGKLHVWALPYGHTASERIMGTWTAPTYQSGMVVPLTPGYKDMAMSFNPALYFRMNENMAPTAVDSSANAAHGSYSGNSMLFDQPGPLGDGDTSLGMIGAPASGGLNVHPVLAHPTQVTYAGWFRRAPSSLPTQYALFSSRNGNNGLIWYTSGTSSLNVNIGDGIASVHTLGAALVTPIPSQWYHLALTQDGATTRMYVGGSMVGAMAMPTYLPASGIVAGVGHEGNSYMWTGGIEEFGVWPTAISSGVIASMAAAGPLGIVGDVSPQFDIRLTTGSYSAGDDGRIALIAALPQASYNPIIPIGSFISLTPSAVIYGASGAWGSQFLAINSAVGSAGAAPPGAAPAGNGGFSFALSPASVYQGENRVMGLVRARYESFGLRAFDPQGNPMGATAVASAMDGWQLVDYGALRIPPWMATAVIRVNAYDHIAPVASGAMSYQRPYPGWTQEHGPIFVLPNGYTLMDLDFNSPVVTMDGFDGSAGSLPGQDQLGNQWIYTSGAVSNLRYTGTSQLALLATSVSAEYLVCGGTVIDPTIWRAEAEGVVAMNAPLTDTTQQQFFGVGFGQASVQNPQQGPWATLRLGTAPWFSLTTGPSTIIASIAITGRPGIYGVKVYYDPAAGFYANLSGPSGAFAGSASGAVASLGLATAYQFGSYLQAGAKVWNGSLAPIITTPLTAIESFRARLLASQGIKPRDIMHLYQPLAQNTRMNPSGIDVVDMQARQRGPVQAIALPVPSLAGGLFVMSLPHDQGAANDILNVDIRVRERFTYAR